MSETWQKPEAQRTTQFRHIFSCFCHISCDLQVFATLPRQFRSFFAKFRPILAKMPYHKMQTINLPKNERSCLGVAKNQNVQVMRQNSHKMHAKIQWKLTIVGHINAEKHEVEVGVRRLGVHARLRQSCCVVYICSLRVHAHTQNSHVSTKLCQMFDQKTSHFACQTAENCTNLMRPHAFCSFFEFGGKTTSENLIFCQRWHASDVWQRTFNLAHSRVPSREGKPWDEATPGDSTRRAGERRVEAYYVRKGEMSGKTTRAPVAGLALPPAKHIPPRHRWP